MAVDHTMVQGDTVSLDFAIVDDDGDAVNLTGATVRWQLSLPAMLDPIVQKISGSGITVTDAVGGLFTVELVSSDTEDLHGTYYHEAEITDVSGNISTVRTGEIVINRGLIR